MKNQKKFKREGEGEKTNFVHVKKDSEKLDSSSHGIW